MFGLGIRFVGKTVAKKLTKKFPNLDANIIAITRDDKSFIPKKTDQIKENDKIYVIINSSQMAETLEAFGHEEKTANSIIIAGGGQIGKNTVNLLNDKMKEINISIIENNRDQANILAEIFANISVINGDALDQDILTEAGISNAETFVSLTNNDEVNIAACQIAKNKFSVKKTICRFKDSTYLDCLDSFGESIIDIPISPENEVTSHLKDFSYTHLTLPTSDLM